MRTSPTLKKELIAVLLLSLPGYILNGTPKLYSFNPTNYKSERLVIMIGDLNNRGKRFDGFIYVYSNPKQFSSPGVRTYFNSTFEPGTEVIKRIDEQGNEFYTVTVGTEFYQKFDFDGLGGRGDKLSSTITFALRQNSTGSDTVFKDISFVEFQGKRYIFPDVNNMEQLYYVLGMVVYIINIFPIISILLFTGVLYKEETFPLFTKGYFYEGVVYRFLSIPMTVLIIRSIIQYIYIFYLWSPLFWFLVASLFNIWKKVSKREYRFGIVFMIIGFVVFLVSFFALDIAFLAMFFLFQVAFVIDFVIMNEKINRAFQFVFYLTFLFFIFYGSFCYSFFNMNTSKGYPINESLPSIFWIIMLVGILVVGVITIVKGGTKHIKGICSRQKKKKVDEKKNEETKKQKMNQISNKKELNLFEINRVALEKERVAESQKDDKELAKKSKQDDVEIGNVISKGKTGQNQNYELSFQKEKAKIQIDESTIKNFEEDIRKDSLIEVNLDEEEKEDFEEKNFNGYNDIKIE